MGNRTGTYVAFDGQGEVNPTHSDYSYYALMLAWKKNNDVDFSFTNSHEKTCTVRDTSSEDTLKRRLCERLSMSKNLVVILTKDTRKSGSMLSYEIKMAIDYYKIPLIIVYPGYDWIMAPNELKPLWPTALAERIGNGTARAIHIPFNKDIILSSINRFSVNGGPLSGALHYYGAEAYRSFGVSVR